MIYKRKIMTPSKSTEKLQIICESIRDKILSDTNLKGRIKSINIDWQELDDGIESIVAPTLDIEFFESVGQ